MPNPHQIGIYTIETHLGGNRIAEVYKAFDPALKRPVALKVLRAESLPEEITPQQILEGAKPAVELVHPHLAWLWETGEAGGYCFLAERFIEAVSLEVILATDGALPWSTSETILVQVAQGLEYAHGRGLIHSNIHPGNILVSPELGAVVTDFGLLIALHSSSIKTQYLAPELLAGGDPSPASDQYALGCVLLEMLTGKRLQQGENAAQVLSENIRIADSNQAVSGRVPWQVIPALRRALAPDPGKRFPTIGEFGKEPARLENGSSMERQKYEAAVQSLRQAEEEARKQAEEANRLEALELARSELEEELLKAGELDQKLKNRQAVAEMDGEDAIDTSSANSTSTFRRTSEHQRSALHLPPKPFRWALAGILLALLSLILLRISQRIPWQVVFPPTATQTPTASASATLTLTPLPSPTSSATFTPTASATASSTPTPTQTATITHTPTVTPTPTRTQKATRSVLDNSRDGQENRSTGGP